MPETKTKNKRQLVDDARRAVLDGRWAEALELNQQIVERYPRDAEAHNRLGRIHMEFKRYSAALEEYTAALRVDPANLIARRNLQRLEQLRHVPESDTVESEAKDYQSIPRTAVFIEEVGRTWIDELINPVALDQLAAVTPGTQLQLIVEGKRLLVATGDGEQLGEIEARTAERVIELMNGGNRYEIYALGLSPHSLRIILREVYRDPGQAGKVSFPRQVKASREYLRERDLLMQRDEAEFYLHDEEEEEEEEEEESLAESMEEDEAAEGEGDNYIDETSRDDDEES